MLTWPHPGTDWRLLLEDADRVFAEIAREVALRERVVVACHDPAHRDHVQDLLTTAGAEMSRVALYTAPSDDSWSRDHGPITVFDHDQPVLLDFHFNGWGRKYPHERDNQITRRLHQQGAFDGTELRGVDLVLEGGSIEVDGNGTLLTTTSCLLSPERNPEYDCIGLEGLFTELFSVQRVLWLEHGHLAGDDTDGHIDTLARFCDTQTIAYVRCDDPDDEHYEPLRAMEEQLRGFESAAGEPYRLVPLPLPAAQLDAHGRRLPATYANFLIINGAVLVPTYNDPADATALQTLQECFTEREVIGVDARPLIHQNGSLHCVTMQLPEGAV